MAFIHAFPRALRATLRLGPALALVALLSACVVVPRTVQVYDEDCRMQVRHMTLEVAQLGSFRACSNEGCLVLLAATGVVAAASVVVSGSIALVGNIVYWTERQGRCARPS